MPGHILIIDSIISNRVMMKSRLKAEYYDVTLAEDGDEGWRLLNERAPDIVFVNTRLSDADGYGFASRIKLHPDFGHIPVVLLAATATDIDWKKAYSNYADDIQVLPIIMTVFQPKLQSLLRSKATLDELRLRNSTPKQIGLSESTATPFIGAPQKLSVTVLAEPSDSTTELLETLQNVFSIDASLHPLELGDAHLPDHAVMMVVQDHLEDRALQIVSKLRMMREHRKKSILFATKVTATDGFVKAFDLGANDAIALSNPGAVAIRLRALSRQMQHEAALADQLDQAIWLAAKDALTGLFNRRYAMHYLSHALEEADPQGRNIAVMMLDLDRFKALNDTFGHAVGDAVLSELGARLMQSFRPSDLVARIGGEEFMIVLKGMSARQYTKIAERVRRIIADTPFEAPGVAKPLSVTVSIGIASMTDNMATVEELMHRADTALYASKEAGRDQVTVAQEAA